MRCHRPPRVRGTRKRTVLLIGPPNVGKSVIFNALTGLDASVANYAGTTVEFSHGLYRFDGFETAVIDVPGTYTLTATNDAERIATSMLSGDVDLVVVVADAANLETSVAIALQIADRRIPNIVALNRVDIAARKGAEIDVDALSRLLNTAVVPTIAIDGTGLHTLKQTIREILTRGEPDLTETEATTERADDTGPVEGRNDVWTRAELIASEVTPPPANRVGVRYGSRALVTPWPGLPIAAGVLAAAFAVIVGLGMGLRRFILLPVSREFLFPFLQSGITQVIGPGIVRNVLIGEYGVVIKGIEWPFTLVLPYVLSFYLAMSLLEDSGYLPRLAVLLDATFARIGLRGSHSISLLLGYGCAIPGILSSRAMGTRRERLIVATLISLAVPCISQTGALFALLAESGVVLVAALFLLSFIVIVVAGIIMDRLMPGEKSELIIELPELLTPPIRLIAKKLVARARQFVIDGAIPMVVAVGVAAILYETGLLARIGSLLSPVVTVWLRMPEEAAVPLLLGVVRRELTVLPLLDMPLTQLQLFVGATVGLFYVPCIAVVATLSREFGVRVALALLGLTTATAFALGGLIAQVGALF
ncbi:MAG: ferrous iron transporter B [Spirochaetaceae bacterium]|nr:MAG: ferrous iron transporter B [Spirochaetaceae bacterium]